MLKELIEEYSKRIKELQEIIDNNYQMDSSSIPIGKIYYNEPIIKKEKTDYQKILQDLEKLKKYCSKKELEYHGQQEDEETGDEYTKIDNAFIDGKIFAIKEIIGE
jgi:hypothetical protein